MLRFFSRFLMRILNVSGALFKPNASQMSPGRDQAGLAAGPDGLNPVLRQHLKQRLIGGSPDSPRFLDKRADCQREVHISLSKRSRDPPNLPLFKIVRKETGASRRPSKPPPSQPPPLLDGDAQA